MSKDYYNILGVSKSASKEEIKRAYRKLAHEYHPDKKGGDEMKFKEINEAYQILSNEQKRQQYDQFGTTFEGFQGAPGWGFSGQGVNFDDLFSNFRGQRVHFDDFDFGDIFDAFFSRAGFRRKKQKNIVINLDIGLKDSLKGIEKEIRLPDLNIKLKIKTKVPKNLSKEIKKLIKKFDKK